MLVVIFRTHSDVEAQHRARAARGATACRRSSRPTCRTSLPADGQRPRRGAHLGPRGRRGRGAPHHRRAIARSSRADSSCACATSSRRCRQAIGYRFRDRGLLEHAMTHTSRANEDVERRRHRQRVARVPRRRRARVRRRRPAVPRVSRVRRGREVEDEGDRWSRPRRSRGRPSGCGLGDHLLLGRGEEKTGGRRKQALLADGYEALIAAIYLDGGIEQARAFIVREFGALRRRPAPRRRVGPGLQVGAAGARAGARPAAARVPRRRQPSGPIIRSCSTWKCWWRGSRWRARRGRARRRRNRKPPASRSVDFDDA